VANIALTQIGITTCVGVLPKDNAVNSMVPSADASCGQRIQYLLEKIVDSASANKWRQWDYVYIKDHMQSTPTYQQTWQSEHAHLFPVVWLCLPVRVFKLIVLHAIT